LPRSLPSELEKFDKAIDQIKISLLYCDEIVIEDSLFALCRASLCNREGKFHPIVDMEYAPFIDPPFVSLKRALLMFAQLRPFFQQRLVRVTSFAPECLGEPPSLVSPGNMFSNLVLNRCRRLDWLNEVAIIYGSSLEELVNVSLGTRNWQDLLIRISISYQCLEALELFANDNFSFCPYLPNLGYLAIFRKLLRDGPTALSGPAIFHADDLSEINTYWGGEPADYNSRRSYASADG
jgi:hypothetical protein